MIRYSIEYRAPRMTRWHDLTVTALAPFTAAEIARYRQHIAEHLTWARGVVVLPDMVRIRQMRDGVEVAQ